MKKARSFLCSPFLLLTDIENQWETCQPAFDPHFLHFRLQDRNIDINNTNHTEPPAPPPRPHQFLLIFYFDGSDFIFDVLIVDDMINTLQTV